jgi:hypothetical protein
MLSNTALLALPMMEYVVRRRRRRRRKRLKYSPSILINHSVVTAVL